MSAEFVDTNILVYAHDGGAGQKHERAVELLSRLFDQGTGALSILVDLAGWTIHRPVHADLVRAARLQRRYQIGWWDALILNSANELGCPILWSEDLGNRQRYGTVVVRNPFA